MRHSSLETINTNVTSADEFVWVDSHNRLVELQQLPWTHHDVLRVLQNGRTREHMEQVSMETIPRLSYLLQRALVRIGRETQRLAKPIGLCSKHEVYSAFKIVLCPALADSCTKVRIILKLITIVYKNAVLPNMLFSDFWMQLYLVFNSQNENKFGFNI
jgi:ankyrin repeat/BTB/POZ domain-containing protein 2